jgi:hypothetical protein
MHPFNTAICIVTMIVHRWQHVFVHDLVSKQSSAVRSFDLDMLLLVIRIL